MKNLLFTLKFCLFFQFLTPMYAYPKQQDSTQTPLAKIKNDDTIRENEIKPIARKRKNSNTDTTKTVNKEISTKTETTTTNPGEKIELIKTRFHYRISGNINFPFGKQEISAGVGGGFTTGFGADIPLSKQNPKWSFQPELMFGINSLPNIKIKNTNTHTQLSYYTFHIPLLFKIQTTNSFYFYAGPTIFSILDITQKQVTLGNTVYRLNLGITGGLQYHFNDKFAFDMRYNYNFFKLYKPNTVTPLTNTSIYPQNVEIGFIYKFKQAEKAIVVQNKSEDLYRDGDILNLSKPLNPEDDSDGDGVPYYKDACPNEPGSDWNNGCPPDNDRDGIPNDKDSCINISGIVKNDGCPINDKDQDGIIDIYDECPDDPGPVTNKGCPIFIGNEDSLKTTLQIKKDSITQVRTRILQKLTKEIQFKVNSHKLKKIPPATIQDLRSIIILDSVIVLNIQAITSGLKDKKKNTLLSKKRLKKLKKEFIRNQIERQRIRTSAIGNDNIDMSAKTPNPKTHLTLSLTKNEEILAASEKQKTQDIIPKVSLTEKDSLSLYGNLDSSQSLQHLLVDTDQDGIIDLEDQCPDKPGPASNFGCPTKQQNENTSTDTSTTLSKNDSNTIQPDKTPTINTDSLIHKKEQLLQTLAKEIQFEPNSNKIKKINTFTIKNLKNIIDNNTDTINIYALTYGLKDKRKNIKLGEKRLKIIKKELIRNGISKQRIATHISEDTAKKNTTRTNKALTKLTLTFTKKEIPTDTKNTANKLQPELAPTPDKNSTNTNQNTQPLQKVNDTGTGLQPEKINALTPEQENLLQKATENIQFKTGSSKLKKSALFILKELSTMIKNNPDFLLNIQTLTTGFKEKKKNVSLSQKCAQTLKKELIGYGVPKKHIATRASEDTQNKKGKKLRNPQTRILFYIEKNGETLHPYNLNDTTAQSSVSAPKETTHPQKNDTTTTIKPIEDSSIIDIKKERIRITEEKASKEIIFKEKKTTFVNPNTTKKVINEIKNLLEEYKNLKLSVKIFYAAQGVTAKELNKLNNLANGRREKIQQEFIKIGIDKNRIETSSEAVNNLIGKQTNKKTQKKAETMQIIIRFL